MLRHAVSNSVWIIPVLGVFAITGAPAARGQAKIPTIQRLSVCGTSPGSSSDPLACPPNTDTQQSVAGPPGYNSINQYGGFGGISDEHQSIFPPKALPGTTGYVFFVATRSQVDTASTGVVALQSLSDPQNGKWSLGPISGFGEYPDGYGQVLLSPVPHGVCPQAASASQQDPTFDLNYAAAGSVVSDPTNPAAGNLLMIYEGVNTCVGNSGGSATNAQNGGVYITTGLATSLDYGQTWPVYRSDFLNPPGLPQQNLTVGPEAPVGASGYEVCMGDYCPLVTYPPANYGRYPALSPPLSLSAYMKLGKPLPTNVADSEPSAFVDDVSGPTYLYEVQDYAPGDPFAGADPGGPPQQPPLPDGRTADLSIARARLNGGTAPLTFLKWNGAAYAEPGMGGAETPFLADGDFGNCADISQIRHSASLSYVEETQQYLLVFVCDSQGEPVTGGKPDSKWGSAWFWATSNSLSDPTKWSAPKAVIGSWNQWTQDVTDSCAAYNGWYPSLMSLNQKPGHLSLASGDTPFVFYMSGCQGTSSRTYMSRVLTITAN